MALIVDMCDEFTVEPTDGVITDAQLSEVACTRVDILLVSSTCDHCRSHNSDAMGDVAPACDLAARPFFPLLIEEHQRDGFALVGRGPAQPVCGVGSECKQLCVALGPLAHFTEEMRDLAAGANGCRAPVKSFAEPLDLAVVEQETGWEFRPSSMAAA